MSHRDPSSSPHPPNRLARESSPYLLQHARNPVDWFPWGPEAVSEARRRNVPIFLSVGYSTCYWCHVMERESFEDPAIGALMSERLVCVKVDREERPDVDQLYMTAVQILTGRGGWPMSVFIEPEKLRPYWAGTYFPPEPRHGLPSFRQALTGMADAWRDKRADVLKQAGAVADAVAAELAGGKQAVAIGRPQISMAVQTLMTIFDRTNGGFGGAPKFPQPVYLELLLDVRARIEEPAQRDAIDVALRTTLDKMALGGMHDQVGGGFHRYSVDAIWLVPHFEKMLYDQAQLLSVYARAATEFNDPFYARVARRTADYVLREMTDPRGAFFTAQDAEVDGQEGLNYLWTIEELNALLPPEDAVFASEAYGVDDGPNFQDPHHPANPPRNVLRLSERPEHAAARKGLSTDQFLARLDAINATLYAARAQRKQPGLDDKVLTSWNGLMIGALARAGRLLNQPAYLAGATRAAEFLLSTLVRDGVLLRTYRQGQAKIPGMLDDYAMLAHGLLELSRASTGEAASNHLEAAEALIDEARVRFGDGAGGWFDTQADQGDLFVRARSTYDGAMPSAMSVMANNLVDLAAITGLGEHAEAAAKALVSISGPIAHSPISTANSDRALLSMLGEFEPDLVAALAEAGAGEARPRPAPGANPVEVFAAEESVEVGPDLPGELHLRIQIARGYHLIAADPGPAPSAQGLLPTRVGISGGAGVRIFADYPAGKPLDPEAPDTPLVYDGTIEFPMALELAGEWVGAPRVTLAFQACTDSECLQPRTITLDVELKRTT